MPPKRKGKVDENVYEKADDLPEGRKKLYDSILEDFDKQGRQNFWSSTYVKNQFDKSFKIYNLKSSILTYVSKSKLLKIYQLFWIIYVSFYISERKLCQIVSMQKNDLNWIEFWHVHPTSYSYFVSYINIWKLEVERWT